MPSSLCVVLPFSLGAVAPAHLRWFATVTPVHHAQPIKITRDIWGRKVSLSRRSIHVQPTPAFVKAATGCSHFTNASCPPPYYTSFPVLPTYIPFSGIYNSKSKPSSFPIDVGSRLNLRDRLFIPLVLKRSGSRPKPSLTESGLPPPIPLI